MGPDETGKGEIYNSPKKGRDREEVPCSTAIWVEVGGFIPKRYGVGMNVGGPEHTGPARQV